VKTITETDEEETILSLPMSSEMKKPLKSKKHQKQALNFNQWKLSLL